LGKSKHEPEEKTAKIGPGKGTETDKKPGDRFCGIRIVNENQRKAPDTEKKKKNSTDAVQ